MVGELVSIHALLAECDLQINLLTTNILCFNPRTPCGVRPIPENHGGEESQFQSTHSLRSATRTSEINIILKDVSIHALLAECDWTEDQTPGSWKSFNPRTPCGVRLVNKVLAAKRNEFQSTHSLRSATVVIDCGLQAPDVSIHALLAECDFHRMQRLWDLRLFQSTHSLRSATAPDHIHCYSTAQTILCANLPKKAIIT